jgi:hypothetical protein
MFASNVAVTAGSETPCSIVMRDVDHAFVKSQVVIATHQKFCEDEFNRVFRVSKQDRSSFEEFQAKINAVFHMCNHNNDVILGNFENQLSTILDVDFDDVADFFALKRRLPFPLNCLFGLREEFFHVLNEMARVVENRHELYLTLYGS